MKNKNKIFFSLVIMALIVAISAVSAVDDDNSTTVSTGTPEVSDSSSEVITTEPIQSTYISNEKVADTKKIEKEDKNIKSSSKTVEVTDSQSFEDAIVLFGTTETWDEGIIELKEGTYDLTGKLGPHSSGNTRKIVINGNNNTITCPNPITSLTDHELILNDITITGTQGMYPEGGNITLNNANVYITNFFGSVGGNMIIYDNSHIYLSDSIPIYYYGGNFFTNDTTLIQKLKEAGVTEENINPVGEEDKNKIIENQTIDGYDILPTYNYTFVNCNITDYIMNQGNLTLINCSFSNNEVSRPGADGLWLRNLGNATLVDCFVENNTFTDTMTTQRKAGVILNMNGSILSLNNTTFKNNKVSYGSVSLILNYGILTCWDHCEFVNNSVNSYYGLATIGNIPDEFTLNVTNSLFENNTVKVFEARNMSVFNSTFTNNKWIYLGSGVAGGHSWDDYGIAISADTLFVDNCTFDGNGIISKDQYTFVGGYGGAIYADYLIVNNSKFTNNIVNTTTTWNGASGKGAAIRVGNVAEVYNSVFENNYASNPNVGIGADIYSAGDVTIKNNTFTNSYANYQASSIYTNGKSNSTIVNNTFNACKSSLDTIVINQNDISNITVADNIYQNTSISDEFILDIPSMICAGDEITITGTYSILNTSFYDEDILDQNQFQIYVNGELNQTVDTLEFTITPTSDNMILTVQPTISQTRKSVIITPITINFTLDDVTATIGETTQITAQITATTDGENMEVNSGRVYFKVNGKILRDTTNGRILYADVTDNTATLDYQVPKTWNENTEIEAVYTGNDEIPQVTSNTVNPSITTPEAQETEFSVADTTATAGSEVTITVTTKNLDNGKVVLKVNGKTVKAADGKLYAKVTGETTTFTYTVPKTLKAGDYTIKAVYTSGATKLEADAMLTVG